MDYKATLFLTGHGNVDISTLSAVPCIVWMNYWVWALGSLASTISSRIGNDTNHTGLTWMMTKIWKICCEIIGQDDATDYNVRVQTEGLPMQMQRFVARGAAVARMATHLRKKCVLWFVKSQTCKTNTSTV
jgi:hypothetical protein